MRRAPSKAEGNVNMGFLNFDHVLQQGDQVRAYEMVVSCEKDQNAPRGHSAKSTEQTQHLRGLLETALLKCRAVPPGLQVSLEECRSTARGHKSLEVNMEKATMNTGFLDLDQVLRQDDKVSALCRRPGRK